MITDLLSLGWIVCLHQCTFPTQKCRIISFSVHLAFRLKNKTKEVDRSVSSVCFAYQSSKPDSSCQMWAERHSSLVSHNGFWSQFGLILAGNVETGADLVEALITSHQVLNVGYEKKLVRDGENLLAKHRIKLIDSFKNYHAVGLSEPQEGKGKPFKGLSLPNYFSLPLSFQKMTFLFLARFKWILFGASCQT